MSLPNKLTMFRIFLIPALLLTYFLRNTLGMDMFWIMGIIFVVASITDYFDGKIARSRGIVTTFGKFMDPLADKLLVISALLVLTDAYQSGFPQLWMPFWIPLLVIARELIVTSIRLVAVGHGNIIAASKLGKYKTAVTMLMISYYYFLMPLQIQVISIIGYVLVSLAVLLTVVSGYDYFMKNKKIIFESI